MDTIQELGEKLLKEFDDVVLVVQRDRCQEQWVAQQLETQKQESRQLKAMNKQLKEQLEQQQSMVEKLQSEKLQKFDENEAEPREDGLCNETEPSQASRSGAEKLRQRLQELEAHGREAESQCNSLRERLSKCLVENTSLKAKLEKSIKENENSLEKAAKHWERVERLRVELANAKEVIKSLRAKSGSGNTGSKRAKKARKK